MAATFYQINEGSGKKFDLWERTKGANTVEQEIVVQDEPYLPSYVVTAEGIAVTTANAHLLQVMAGAGNRVRIKRFSIQQVANAGAATVIRIQLIRLTTAGTGGTALTPALTDPVDSAATCTAMTLPSSKGAESTVTDVITVGLTATSPATAVNSAREEWPADLNHKGPTIAAGTANGYAFKLSAAAGATATVDIVCEVVEMSYS